MFLSLPGALSPDILPSLGKLGRYPKLSLTQLSEGMAYLAEAG